MNRDGQYILCTLMATVIEAAMRVVRFLSSHGCSSQDAHCPTDSAVTGLWTEFCIRETEANYWPGDPLRRSHVNQPSHSQSGAGDQ